MRFENTIEIEAPVQRVWALNTDVESWPAITPTVTKVERLDRGPFRTSSTARVKQPGQRTKVWTVTSLDPEHSFTWEARVLGTQMTASHTVTPNGSGASNTLVLEVTGPGSGLVGRLVGRQISKVLATENANFKRVAEA